MNNPDSVFIPVLQPDMPDADELHPLLKRIDAARWYTNFGPLVYELEAAFASRFFPDAPVSLTTVANGTVALELAIQALRLAPGTAVLLPAYSFPATLGAVLRCGMKPVFADIDPVTWCLSPDHARDVVRNSSIGLVMPVATFGFPVDASSWRDFMLDTGIPVIVDAAAALGSQPVSEGPLFCFSLHATKPFACGEGGLVVGSSARFIDRVRRLSNFGLREFVVDAIGTNGKMSEYHAAAGLAQMSRFGRIAAMRERNWLFYREQLAGLPLTWQGDERHATAVLSVLFENGEVRQRVEKQLASDAIGTRRWYSTPLNQVPGLNGESPASANIRFDVASRMVDASLGLPFHTGLVEADIARVAAGIRSAIRG